ITLNVPPLCCTQPRAVGSAPSTLPGGRCAGNAAPSTLCRAVRSVLCVRRCAPRC
ncbi:hypothetical protein T492DRAFT_979944, partial [Pavlovales sp. CCMP2436]